MAVTTDLQGHLESGATTLCRCWRLERSDGTVLGFTDHDRDLVLDGLTFGAASGMTAQALERAGGLAADNSEALGALASTALQEAELRAGLWDGAEVELWVVNWAEPSQRALRFRGEIGRITREDGAFRAELLGLSARLSRPAGRVFQKICPAILGDAACGVDLSAPGLSHRETAWSLEQGRVLRFADPGGFADGWFAGGAVLEGGRTIGTVKRDRREGTERVLELWQRLALPPAAGVELIFQAGCDRRLATCRDRFANSVNFRGFPHLPGDDWLTTTPGTAGVMDGGSLQT